MQDLTRILLHPETFSSTLHIGINEHSGLLREEIRVTKRHFSVSAFLLVSMSFPNLVNAGVCELASTTYSKVVTGAAGIGVATGSGLKLAGVISVLHSSGLAIAATTSSGYVAGTVGAIGVATGFLTAPATLIIGGVAVAASGGTIAYCEYNK